MTRLLRLATGTVLIAISAALFIPRFIIQPSDSTAWNEYRIEADANGLGASFENDLTIELFAPESVVEGSSFNIHLNYSRFRYPARRPERITFELVSTAFEYKPTRPIEAPSAQSPSDSDGASAEKVFIWNLSPIPGKTGKQELFIEIGGVSFSDWTSDKPSLPKSTSLTYTKNDKTASNEFLGHVIPITVRVTSVYGIPMYLARIIQPGAALVGFILTYPMVLDLIKERFTSQKSNIAVSRDDSKQ